MKKITLSTIVIALGLIVSVLMWRQERIAPHFTTRPPTQQQAVAWAQIQWERERGRPSAPATMVELVRREDLASAADEAIATGRSDMMLLGVQILTACERSLGYLGRQPEVALGLASDHGMAKEAAEARKQQIARDRMHERCNGLEARGGLQAVRRRWKEVTQEVCARDDDIGVLQYLQFGKMPTMCATRDISQQRIDEAARHAMAAPNRVSVPLLSFALMEPGTPDHSPLLNALMEVYGREMSPPFGQEEMDRLRMCLEVAPWMCDETKWEIGEDEAPLVKRYVEALRSGDPAEVRRVK